MLYYFICKIYMSKIHLQGDFLEVLGKKGVYYRWNDIRICLHLFQSVEMEQAGRTLNLNFFITF